MMMKHGVMSLTIGRVLMETWQAVSLHRRNAAEDETRMTEICAMSPVAEMHVARLKTGAKSTKALNRSSVKKGTMTTMVPIMTNLINSFLPSGAQCRRSHSFFHDLKRVCWPLNFKPLGIEKYDGSTNPAEWLEVYQVTIEATGGDSYVMANYLPVCLLSSARTWLLGLPVGSVCSWSHLCQLFTSNFCATCTHPGVD
jgi:hypothetical protein